MTHAIAYLAALLVFGVVDALWLWIMSRRLYRPVLGEILLTDLRMTPALLFYFTFPIGLTIFSIMPAVAMNSSIAAIGYGALFGAFAYATYDLTNYATLRKWTLQLTIVDLAYGVTVASLTSLAAFWAVKAWGGTTSIT